MTAARSGRSRRETAARGARRLGPDLARARGAEARRRASTTTTAASATRPKFPNTMALDVLLRAARRGRPRAARVERALDAMRAGGIWDQLGGGFHRYSTDERWLVPHFEKMLYDNALLLRLYVDGWRATRRGVVRRDGAATSRRYVAREMTVARGRLLRHAGRRQRRRRGEVLRLDAGRSGRRVRRRRRSRARGEGAFDVTEDGNFEDSGATVLSRSARSRASRRSSR